MKISKKKSIQENSHNFLNITTPEEKKWFFDRSQSGFSVHFGSFMVQKGAREEMGHDPKNDTFLEKRRPQANNQCTPKMILHLVDFVSFLTQLFPVFPYIFFYPSESPGLKKMAQNDGFSKKYPPKNMIIYENSTGETTSVNYKNVRTLRPLILTLHLRI